MKKQFSVLKNKSEGAFYFEDNDFDNSTRLAYSTDTSVYQEKTIAVALPATKEDIKKLIHFATANRLTLTLRAAGTSLAWQVVGNGIVVDTSVGWDKIIALNITEKGAIVQTGIIRDDLNKYLQQYGLMYGPNLTKSILTYNMQSTVTKDRGVSGFKSKGQQESDEKNDAANYDR